MLYLTINDVLLEVGGKLAVEGLVPFLLVSRVSEGLVHQLCACVCVCVCVCVCACTYLGRGDHAMGLKGDGEMWPGHMFKL